VGDSLASGLYVMDADGSGVTRLARGWYPAWSPDGSRIAFHTDIGVDSGGIHVVNADGSGLTRLLRHAYAAFPPMKQHCVCQVTWSPDGRRLAFIRGNYEEGSWIHVMNADGSSPGMLPLASPGDGVPTQADPAWSPDGSRIAFASADGRTITSADLKGELRTHVRMGFVERPGWSRDGRHLVFTRGDGPPVIERRIWVASVETGAVRQLIPKAVGPAQRTYSDYDPAWW
jgi:TolB protein